MTIIDVPKPPQSAYDPYRPISALLKTQIDHLYEAEMKLPLQYRTNIYVNAIKTETEAAKYIEAVTEAIRKAHSEADAQRKKRPIIAKRPLEIAAAAATRRSRSTKKTRKRVRRK